MKRRRPPTKAETELAVLKWSTAYPEGTAVIVTRDDGSELHTKTRSEPWNLCGTAVIMVEGIMLIRLTHQTTMRRF